MREIRIALVEDEDIFADRIREYLSRYEKEAGVRFLIRRFRDGQDIVERYKGVYDIIFLDIVMKYMDGMQAAMKIREVDDQTILIFLTNMTDYAVQGYKVEALSYIVKPIEYFEFSQVLDRAIVKLEAAVKKYVTITVDDGIQKLEISDIYYIESFGHTLVYHSRQGVFSLRGSIGEMEQELEQYDFFRCNKGILVNLQWVSSIKNNSCVIKGETLQVSRRRYKQFTDALLGFMSREL